jgi:hypothetical protein
MNRKTAVRVLATDHASQTWPVCHVIDNTNLYLQILRSILAGENPGYGKNGFYLASPGSVAWDDLYAAMAVTLAKRGAVDDASVENADDAALEKMGAALKCPKEWVAWQIGGRYIALMPCALCYHLSSLCARWLRVP